MSLDNSKGRDKESAGFRYWLWLGSFLSISGYDGWRAFTESCSQVRYTPHIYPTTRGFDYRLTSRPICCCIYLLWRGQMRIWGPFSSSAQARGPRARSLWLGYGTWAEVSTRRHRDSVIQVRLGGFVCLPGEFVGREFLPVARPSSSTNYILSSLLFWRVLEE